MASALQLLSSEPPVPVVTVAGDSRGGLIGILAMPGSRGMPAAVSVSVAVGDLPAGCLSGSAAP